MDGVDEMGMRERFLKLVDRNASRCVDFLRSHGDYAAVDQEHDNLLAALDWSYQAGNLRPVIDIATALSSGYWMERGRWSHAIQYLEIALAASAEAGDYAALALISNRLGNFYSELGDHLRALDFHYRALGCWERIGDRVGMARADGNIGRDYYDTGDRTKATEYMLKSLEITEALGVDVVSANQYDNLSRLLTDRGEWTRAERLLLKSLKIRKQIGDTHGIGRIHINLGIIYNDRCQWEKAHSHYGLAQRIFRKLEDHHLLAMILQNMGVLYYRAGKTRKDLEKALELQQKAVTFYKRLGETTYGLARTYFALGDVYLRQGEWEKALRCYEESQPLVDSEGSESYIIAEPRLRIATSYLEMGRWEDARTSFEKARPWLEIHDDRLPLVRLYGGLSAALLKLGDLVGASQYAQLCLSQAMGPEDEYSEGIALAQRALGDIHAFRGETEDAIHLLSLSLDRFTALGLWYEVGKTHLCAALSCQARSPGQAATHLEKALDIFSQLDAIKDVERVQNALGVDRESASQSQI